MEINVYLNVESLDEINKIMARIKELGLTDVKHEKASNNSIVATYNGDDETLRKFVETICTEFGDAIEAATRSQN